MSFLTIAISKNMNRGVNPRLSKLENFSYGSLRKPKKIENVYYDKTNYIRCVKKNSYNQLRSKIMNIRWYINYINISIKHICTD